MPVSCVIYKVEGFRNVEGLAKALSVRRGELRLLSVERGEGGLKVAAEAPDLGPIKFWALAFRGRVFLTLMGGKRKARRALRSLEEVVGESMQEVRIPSSKLRELCEEGIVKLVVLDLLQELGLRKVVMSGSSVTDTSLYRENVDRSEVSYVLTDIGGKLIGVSSGGSVVSFTRLDEDDLVEFVKERVLPLLAPPS